MKVETEGRGTAGREGRRKQSGDEGGRARKRRWGSEGGRSQEVERRRPANAGRVVKQVGPTAAPWCLISTAAGPGGARPPIRRQRGGSNEPRNNGCEERSFPPRSKYSSSQVYSKVQPRK